MRDIEYAAPLDVDEAVGLLASKGSRAAVLAGGTDILVQMRESERDVDLVVDVKRIPELMEITYSTSHGLRMGAAVPCYQVYRDAAIAAAYPALADAARIIGGWQIQSRASIGGNLCNSSPAADSIPPLIVHQATCHIAGPQGRRTVSAEDFCLAPGNNVLEEGEMLVAITLPPPRSRASSAYLRFIPRNEMDIAVVGSGAWIELDEEGKTVQEARIALAAVAPTPVAAVEAARFLTGKPIGEDSFAEAGELARKAASPISDMRGTAEYRRHLVGVLTRRALDIAARRARESVTDK